MIENFANAPRPSDIPRWLAEDVGISPDTSLERSRRVAAAHDLRHDRLVEDLQGVPLFSSLAKRRRRVVEQLVTPRRIQERTVVAIEGSQPRELVVVVDGVLEARQRDDVVTTHGPGSCVGAAGLLANRPRATTLVAATPLRALVVGRTDFSRLLHRVPEVAQRLHAQIGQAALAGVPPELAA